MTGSIAISRAATHGVGVSLGLYGVTVLVISAVLHVNAFHAFSALLFAACLAGLRILASADRAILRTPWRHAVWITDIASVSLLCVATFGPLILMEVHGTGWWDVVVLSGVLLLWWVVLRQVIADYRRTARTVLTFLAVWLPTVALPLPESVYAEVTAAQCVLASGVSLWAIRHSQRGLSPQYRRLRRNPFSL